ncbi:class I SAM-dependent methyltransferase [Marinobacterium arenosum]|uniref:class I SAM-dependent methyltransferase n=1 Tax=Marinobacterium arenosum TaxID=2862496 RepID=UPI001C96C0BD|nr:methyltransferase domain-containing protein [Marinobacterium arenosum]MBY4675331.1 methyltransferase domain-containing protein [Marinobacterium arenosum]
MFDDKSAEQQIRQSWQRNADPWVEAVRAQRIESRRLCTDRAIVEAVLSVAPNRLIDLGCGEGWLCRRLAGQGISVIGIDAVPALIDQARLAGDGDYRLLSYEQIIAGELAETVDTVVCNFSLFGNAAVAELLRAVARLLAPGGMLIIQTLHPLTSCGDEPYRDGWRSGSWAGIDGNFTDPAPWYFRTLASWLQLLADCGYRLRTLQEPVHPASGKPASVIFIAEPVAGGAS